MEDSDIREQLSPAAFVKKYPNVISKGGLQWQIHNGQTNGLDASGAILRIRNHPDAKRASLRIIPAKYFAWQTKGGAV